jgi:hypothetical protein
MDVRAKGVTMPPTGPQRLALVAVEVGAAYLAASREPDDGFVIAAYERLQSETDLLFEALVDADAPEKVRVVFTECRDPYQSDRELIASVRATGVLEVTSASVEREPLHPVLGCELGGAFDRFRAVHDVIGHARTGLGFELGDELEAWRIQDRLHGGLARLALATELLAINSARSIIGEAPEHKAMLLDAALLDRARACVAVQ